MSALRLGETMQAPATFALAWWPSGQGARGGFFLVAVFFVHR
jgi:hypothetical protein